MRICRSRWLIASAAFVAACGSHEGLAGSAGPVGGTVIIAAPSDATDPFPPFTADQVGRWVQDQVFDRLAEIKDSLVTVGDKGFAPRLAKSWTWSPDSLSIAFTIDPKARWHDGKPVTANDVRYTFKTFTDPKVGSPVAPLLSNIDSISVRDSSTAVAWFKRRKPEQFYDLAYQLVIIPEHVYGSIPPEQLHTSPATRNLIGSGRFRLQKWDAGSRIVLVSDTGNYRGRAKLDRVIFAVTSPATGATELFNGEADFMQQFPFDQAGKLDSSAVARPVVIPVISYGFMGMNRFARKSTTALHPIFADKRVRLALSMAVDRQAMVHNVFDQWGRVAHGPFTTIFSFADSSTKVPPYDIAAANALLDSAGWRLGPDSTRQKAGRKFEFHVLAPTSSAPRMRYSILLQEAFKRVGAHVIVDQLDPQAAGELLQHGDFDAALLSFAPDPSVSDTKQFWGTSGMSGDGQNFIRYSNPVVDAAIDSAESAYDPAKEKAYAMRAFNTIIDDAPGIWLYDLVSMDAVNRRIALAPMRVDEWWANLADWTIPVDKRIDRDRIGLASVKP